MGKNPKPGVVVNIQRLRRGEMAISLRPACTKESFCFKRAEGSNVAH